MRVFAREIKWPPFVAEIFECLKEEHIISKKAIENIKPPVLKGLTDVVWFFMGICFMIITATITLP